MATLPKYCDTPEKVEEWKEKQRAYQKAYYQTPDYKAQQKAYKQTPKVKARDKARAQTPEYKAYQKAYLKAYKQNLRKEQSTADAFRMMQAASELAKALTNLSEQTPKNK